MPSINICMYLCRILQLHCTDNLPAQTLPPTPLSIISELTFLPTYPHRQVLPPSDHSSVNCLHNYYSGSCYHYYYHHHIHYVAINALTLLAEHQEKHPGYKSWVMRCWCGHLSEARYKWFAHGSADANVTLSLKPQNGLPFWRWLSQVVLEKRPLNEAFIAGPLR